MSEENLLIMKPVFNPEAFKIGDPFIIHANNYTETIYGLVKNVTENLVTFVYIRPDTKRVNVLEVSLSDFDKRYAVEKLI